MKVAETLRTPSRARRRVAIRVRSRVTDDYSSHTVRAGAENHSHIEAVAEHREQGENRSADRDDAFPLARASWRGLEFASRNAMEAEAGSWGTAFFHDEALKN